MAARAIWKGVLQLGGEGLPVKLYSAVEDKAVHFHLLERKSLQRVKQHMVDPTSGKEVPTEEIRRAAEVEPETFVVLDRDELAKLEPEPSRDIEVPHFIPADKISHQWYERPYYLGPDESDKAYFAFAAALEKSGREGLARWTMRKNRYLGALRARDGYLLLMKLRYAEEVLSARELPAPSGRALDPREIQMAEQLVRVLEDDFRPQDFRDEYRERVLAYIEEKAKGRKPKLAAMPKPKATRSLAEVLEASLNAAKDKGKAVA